MRYRSDFLKVKEAKKPKERVGRKEGGGREKDEGIRGRESKEEEKGRDILLGAIRISN